MEVYYQDESVQIFHGDCREILPSLRGALVCTDPPYNCGKDYGVWDDDLPTPEYQAIMREVVALSLTAAPNQAWVAPRYQLPFWLDLLPKSHLVAIRRGARGPYRGGWSDQFEIALAIGKPSSAECDLWDDIRLKGEGYFFREQTFEHPGYTPYPIGKRFISLLSGPSDVVIEPFAGTGTFLRAAKDLGRKAIGIEINEAYCEIAAKRMSQEVFQWNENAKDANTTFLTTQ